MLIIMDPTKRGGPSISQSEPTKPKELRTRIEDADEID
jgi:hypothetical protein